MRRERASARGSQSRRDRRVLLIASLLILAAGPALSPALAVDCNANGIEDECDLDCGETGGPCDLPGCGGETDCNGNGIPDSCDVAENGEGCAFTSVLASNGTTGPDASFTGPPDDVYYGLGGQQVTYRFDCGFIYDGPGADFNVYEVDSGTAEFNLLDVLVSVDGVAFVSIRASSHAKVDIDGDETHSNASFARSFDLAYAGLSIVRFVRLDGDGTGASGASAGFDLDAIGVIHRLGLDCDADGTLDACQGPPDCDADGAPDACAVDLGAVADCNANDTPDPCDAGSTSPDCDANQVPDECQEDCDANGSPDVCDTAGGAGDCNGNARPDSCDLADEGPAYTTGSPTLRPLDPGVDLTWTIPAPFSSSGAVTLTVTAFGDLGATNEFVDVALNGAPVGRLFDDATGRDCASATDSLTIDAGTFNESVAGANAVFTFVSGSNVACETCTESWLEAEIAYDAIVDCNLNARVDRCDITLATSADLNLNGIPDECEADCNGNGTPDDYDVEQGISPDCNGNINPDECDVASGTSVDCDGNGIPDECEPDCNGNGITDACDIRDGTSPDCDANAVPDECDLAATGAGCPFPLRLADNSTGIADARFLGPPDDAFYGLGGQIVTWEWTCGRIIDGPGADLTLYEVDSGGEEFSAITLLVSEDGVQFVDITSTMVASVRIPGDEAHGSYSFRRSFDVGGSGLESVRFVRIDGEGTGSAGPGTGFDLDAIGALHLVDRDCNDDGALDVCAGFVDCDADGLPDPCEVAVVQNEDCNANAVPDSCDIAGGSLDCDGDGTPDECEADCNGNSVADDCDLSGGSASDCNGNARPDSCDLAVTRVIETSRDLAPTGDGYPQSFALLGPPPAIGVVTVTVTVVADVLSNSEYYAISLNGTSIGRVFDDGGADCSLRSDSLQLTADEFNARVGSGNATFTASSTGVEPWSCAGSFLRFRVEYDAETDCDGNAVLDTCDVGGGAEDCDANGIPDSCEEDCDENGVKDICDVLALVVPDCNDNLVPDSCDLDSAVSEDCNADGVPDECPICPPVQVAYIMDTSTSMNDEGTALCASIAAIDAELQADLGEFESEALGIMAPGTGQFSCLTASVAGLYGTTVPGDPPPQNETLGACPGGSEVGSEDWGRATSVTAGNKPWADPSIRIVLPLADEGPWCGDPVSDPGVDRDSITHASRVATDNAVIVSPITGTGSSAAVIGMAEDLAEATGGLAQSSTQPDEDLAAAIKESIRDACREFSDCNRNNRPDSCDLADGTSEDCDFNARPDECQPDCNGNGVADPCDIRDGTSLDENLNAIPDECEILGLALTVSDLEWTEVPDAIAYDAVRGDTLVLRSSGGDFTAAIDSCLVNDTTSLTWPHGDDPPEGGSWFYLVRAELTSGPLSYDGTGSGLAAPRDPGIEASPEACP